MHSFALDAAVKLEYFDLLPRAEAASADPRVFVMTLFIRLPRHRHHWLINIFSHLSLYLCVCLLPLSLPLYFILSVNHSPLSFCPFSAHHFIQILTVLCLATVSLYALACSHFLIFNFWSTDILISLLLAGLEAASASAPPDNLCFSALLSSAFFTDHSLTDWPLPALTETLCTRERGHYLPVSSAAAALAIDATHSVQISQYSVWAINYRAIVWLIDWCAVLWWWWWWWCW